MDFEQIGMRIKSMQKAKAPDAGEAGRMPLTFLLIISMS